MEVRLAALALFAVGCGTGLGGLAHSERADAGDKSAAIVRDAALADVAYTDDATDGSFDASDALDSEESYGDELPAFVGQQPKSPPDDAAPMPHCPCNQPNVDNLPRGCTWCPTGFICVPAGCVDVTKL